MESNEIYCRLFEKNIRVGLCADVAAVSGRFLKREAVPEVAEFSQDEIQHACEHCPHVD